MGRPSGIVNDITGNSYGRLKALELVESRNGKTYWLFKCRCGNRKAIRVDGVLNGTVRSCGCLLRENNATGNNSRQHGDAQKGQVKRLHNIWRGILKRCDATHGEAYEKYAKRGIRVCEEWRDYVTFRT